MAVRLAGLDLEYPILNGAGTCRTVADVKRFAFTEEGGKEVPTEVGAITVGSITLEPREGNKGETFWVDDYRSVNALGMPNRGLPYYREVLPEMVQIAHGAGKPLIVSVAGFSPEEYAQLAEEVLERGADMAKLNLGCPNVWSGSGQKPIAGFDLPLINAILNAVEHRVGVTAGVAVKLVPYSNPDQLRQTAEYLRERRLVKVLMSMNTVPNAFVFNERGAPMLGAEYGGLAGDAIFPMALGQVRQLCKHLQGKIPVVGLGGISSGAALRDHLRAGAVAGGVVTACHRVKEDQVASVFTKILAEYIDLLEASPAQS